MDTSIFNLYKAGVIDVYKRQTWDSAPKVLTPTADGTQTYTCDVASIDASNSGSGYIIEMCIRDRYVTVPISLPVPSSLKVIAALSVIFSDFVSDDAAVAADAQRPDDRSRLEAG